MKPISAKLLAHLQGEVTSLAACWKLTRRDNISLGFTGHDRDIIFGGLTYVARPGFVPGAIASSCGLAVDNIEIESMVDGGVISESEISAGIYDFAGVEIFMVNFNDLSQGRLDLHSGQIGEVKYGKGRFKAELRGLMQSFTQVTGELYSPSCRAQLGDSRCGLNIADLTVTGSITSLSCNQLFADASRSENAGYFTMGKITFTSGNNAGLAMEVKEYNAGGRMLLVFPMPYDIAVGDGYMMQAGCDKNFSTCIAKFNNAVNFQGEPHVPGTDAMLKTAGTR